MRDFGLLSILGQQRRDSLAPEASRQPIASTALEQTYPPPKRELADEEGSGIVVVIDD
jgi:hypothetical protein